MNLAPDFSFLCLLTSSGSFVSSCPWLLSLPLSFLSFFLPLSLFSLFLCAPLFFLSLFSPSLSVLISSFFLSFFLSSCLFSLFLCAPLHLCGIAPAPPCCECLCSLYESSLLPDRHWHSLEKKAHTHTHTQIRTETLAHTHKHNSIEQIADI